MSIIEELGELSLICAGQREEIQELKQLLNAYYQLVQSLPNVPFGQKHIWMQSLYELQQRAKQLLGE